MVRFIRQRNRVVGALLTPVIFWVLLGSGFDRSFQSPAATGGESEGGYLVYFFPGMVVMVLLFTAIFSTFSVIEDRREGFLQGVVAAPIPRLAIVLGKVLGGATLASGQGLIVLLIWPIVARGELAGLPAGAVVGAMVLTAGLMFIVAMGLTALGLYLAWPMDSTAGFHAIMNLLLLPMWFLCGAVFPVASAPLWMQIVMYANPLTYGQALVRSVMMGTPAAAQMPAPQWLIIVITFGFTAVMIWLAAKKVARPRKDGQA